MPGPFYFAWIEAPEAFNPDYHAIEDEDVFSFTVSHAEGEIPTLQLTVVNPRVGLLSRPVWAWLSWDKNWVQTEDHTPDIVPLFLGRLIGIPNSLNKDLVTLDFIARPKDHAAQRTALADSLRVAPFWDYLWVSPDRWEDPDAVLEGYSKLWHFDRVTGEITVSDIITGEDGVEEFQESEIPADGVRFSLSTAPFRMVEVRGTAPWTQKFGGAIILTKGQLKTFTGESLINDWPEDESSLGDGYVAKACFIEDVWGTADIKTYSYNVEAKTKNDKPAPGDTISSVGSGSVPDNLQYPDRWVYWPLTLQTDAGIGKSSVNQTYTYVQKWFLNYQLGVTYAAERERNETAHFILEANIQPILSDPDEVEIHQITVSANKVDEPLPGEDLPLGDIARASFFETDRGQQALQYLFCLARASLVNASRCIEITATIPFERAIDLTCRKMGIINDRGLPGGQALGKVKEYSFSCDGNTGAMVGSVTIASAIGYGDALEAEQGEPTYVDDDYVEEAYQQYEGQVTVIGTGDIAYEVPLFAGEDDGLRFPLKKSDIVISEQWHGDVEAQQAYIEGARTGSWVIVPGYGWTVRPEDVLDQATLLENAKKHVGENMPHWYEVELRNLNGKFTNAYNVTTFKLELPKQIDLEFSAS